MAELDRRSKSTVEPETPALADLLGHPRAHLQALDAALAHTYGTPVLQPDGDLLGGLIETVLSQSTSDLNSSRAYASLCRHFPTWEQVRTAPVDAVAAAIRSGGLAELKAKRIQQILASIAECDDALSRATLEALPIAEARKSLCALPGVGPKTASCVLLFNLGRPAFPVDTHVHRLSRRIGFAAPNASPERVQDLVEAQLAPERAYPLHVNLISHGRQVCKAQRPLCAECSIRPLCRFGTDRAFSSVS